MVKINKKIKHKNILTIMTRIAHNVKNNKKKQKKINKKSVKKITTKKLNKNNKK